MHRIITNMKSVAKALITGVIPTLIFENISIGKVVAPGPVKKLAITKSSSDIMNASIQLDSIDLLNIGNFIFQKTTNGLAPKFNADSSIDLSSINNLDLIFM